MFDFDWKIKKSFTIVKREFEALKTGMHGWTRFTESKQTAFEKRLDRIENRIERLEEMLMKIFASR